MVMRWLWWTPLVLLTAFAALMALRYGTLAANTTETEIINLYAQIYVDSHGGKAALTDCAAEPVKDIAGVWLVVFCTPLGAGQSYDYYVNRLGGLAFSAQPGETRSEGPSI